MAEEEKKERKSESVDPSTPAAEDAGTERTRSADAAQSHNAPEPEGAGELSPSRRAKLPTQMPVLWLREHVVFPVVVMPLHVRDERHLQLVEQAILGDKIFLAVTTKEQAPESPDEVTPEHLYAVGTTCAVLQMLRTPDGTVRLLAQGITRSRIRRFTKIEPYFQALVEHLSDEESDDVETQALFKNLREQFLDMVEVVSPLSDDVKVAVNNIEDPGHLADLVTSNLSISKKEKQGVLEILNVKSRLQRVTRILAREKELADLAHKIQDDARSEIDKGQREFYLRQQLKSIQKELGETDPLAAEAGELRERLHAKDLPEEACKEAKRELGRLERMNPASPEYTVARTYLDWIIALPWNESTPDNLDLETAQKVLEEDHYGLDDVKKRMLEFLAVRKLREDMTGSILCFVGPPGTGKTSIGKSIARAMGRKYLRISLGGIRDEAEIRGHRRTYVGSLPGRIINGLRKAGSNNPVFMLDEIDKIGADFRGDPSSALLEVLDSEQNNAFSDHYLDVPFDLSRVLFITTANVLDTIAPALKDRMEVLEFPGYTDQEKLQIAKRYLVPQQIEAHGLKPEQFSITDEAIGRLIHEYTREAGVRNLERQIASLCRKVARDVATEKASSGSVEAEAVPDFLGPPQFLPEVAERLVEPGIASGLAWTPAGGEILFIEATKTPGDGKLILTGRMGDVMKESAQAALTHVRAHHELFGVDPGLFKENDIHIHVPAGAVPKDGPSAGVAIAMALVSLCRNVPVTHSVAATGEITLRGQVLPVGGIKEKVLAALRAEIETVILPKRNEKDMPDVPAYAKEHVKFVFVDKVEEIMPVAFANEETRKKE